VGGIGKSTLATQIASRVARLAPERVVTVVSGEVPAASLAAEPAETDLVVLDNFDDNLTCERGVPAIRDPALAALLAGWTGKLVITCASTFAAAGYWHARTATPRLCPRAQLEAAYHLRQAGDLAAHAAAAPVGPEVSAASSATQRRRLRRLGLVSAAGVAAVVLAIEATNTLAPSHLTALPRGPVGPVPRSGPPERAHHRIHRAHPARPATAVTIPARLHPPRSTQDQAPGRRARRPPLPRSSSTSGSPTRSRWPR